MSDDDKLGDLWASLGQDVERSGEDTKISLPRTPVTRRVSLREKLAAAYLNGFFPALLALFAGCLMAVADYQAILPEGASLLGGVLVLGLLMSLPLAWLTASLWAVDGASIWRYLSLAWLAGGVGQVSMVLPYCAASSMSNIGVTLESSARYLQKLYESYLSFPPFLIYALVAAALLALSARLRRSLPWVELGKPSSLARRGGAVLVVLAPLGFLAGGALTQGRIAPQAMWAYSTVYAPEYRLRGNDGWQALKDTLVAQDPKYFDYSINRDQHVPTWSKATLRQVQAQSEDLLTRKTPANGWPRHGVIEALLRHHDDLDQPVNFAWTVLTASLKDSENQWAQDAHWALFSVLLPHLSQAPLSPEQLSADLKRVEDLQATMISPQQEAEKTFLQSVGSYLSDYHRELPKPMMAFGMEVPFGPEQILAEIRLRQVVYPWMAIKDKLDWSSEKALSSSAMSQAKLQNVKVQRRKGNVFEYSVTRATESCSNLQLTPYFDAARLIIALRLHKAETGAYPATLDQVSSRLPKGLALGRWGYENKDGKATLALPAAGREPKKGGPTWVLR